MTCFQLVSPHAGEDDDELHIAVVHDFDHTVWRHVGVDAGDVIDVVMDVDHVELRRLHREVR